MVFRLLSSARSVTQTLGRYVGKVALTVMSSPRFAARKDTPILGAGTHKKLTVSPKVAPRRQKHIRTACKASCVHRKPAAAPTSSTTPRQATVAQERTVEPFSTPALTTVTPCNHSESTVRATDTCVLVPPCLDDHTAPTTTSTCSPHTNAEVVAQNITVPVKLDTLSPSNVNAVSLDGSTHLNLAVENNNLELSQTLIDAGANVNSKDRRGMTPAMLAVRAGSLAMLELLVKAGANLRLPNPAGNNVLHLAVMSSHLEMVKMILETGIKFNAKNKAGKTPVMLASTLADSSILELLISHHADVHATDTDRKTAMHHAVKHGRTDSVRVLFAAGADIDAPDFHGWTPIMQAVEDNNVALAELLGRSGALLERMNKSGKTVLDIAPSGNMRQMLQALSETDAEDVSMVSGPAQKRAAKTSSSQAASSVSCPATPSITFSSPSSRLAPTPLSCPTLTLSTPPDSPFARNLTTVAAPASPSQSAQLLRNAIETNATDFFDQQIGAGTDVNVVSPDGSTPLHLAIKSENLEMVRTLLKAGADANAKDWDGLTPAMLAVKLRSPAILTLLVRAGADLSVRDGNGDTATQLAVNANNLDMTKLLVDASANQTEPLSPIYLTVSSLSYDVLDFLVTSQVPVTVNVIHNHTVLLTAVRDGRTDLVKLLLEAKADVNVKGAHGVTPLMLAAKLPDSQISELLIKHGADVNPIDNSDNFVVHNATAANVRLLNRFYKSQLSATQSLTHSMVISQSELAAEPAGRTSPSVASIAGDFVEVPTPVQPAAFVPVATSTQNDQFVTPVIPTEHVEVQLSPASPALPASETSPAVIVTPLALHRAVKLDNADEVRSLLATNADINVKDECGMTPLMLAVCNRAYKSFIPLLEAHPDLELKNNDGNTALHLVIAKDGSYYTGALVAAGACVNTPDCHGVHPLVHAIQTEDHNLFSLLLTPSANARTQPDVNVYTLYGNTPLHLAVSFKSFAMVKELVDAGANVNAKNRHGMTPVMLAMNAGFENISRLLSSASSRIVSRGTGTRLSLSPPTSRPPPFSAEQLAEVNTRDKLGNTRLMTAVSANNVSEVYSLLKSGADVTLYNNRSNTALHTAINLRKLDLVKIMVAAGADVNAVGADGMNPLMRAVAINYKCILEFLLHVGASAGANNDPDTALHLAVRKDRVSFVKTLLQTTDINIKDRAGNTPLTTAINYQNFAMINLLTSLGANPNTLDNEGIHPIIRAVSTSNVALLEQLVDARASCNVASPNGNYALHLAVKTKKLDMVRMLAGAGADVNVQDSRGTTPTMLAATLADSSILKFMIIRRAALDVRDQAGNTALHHAVLNKCSENAEALILAGADTNIKNENALSPLRIATKNECEDMAKMLRDAGATIDGYSPENPPLLPFL